MLFISDVKNFCCVKIVDDVFLDGVFECVNFYVIFVIIKVL